MSGIHRVEDNAWLATQLDFVALLTMSEREATDRPSSRFGVLPELPVELYSLWRLRSDLLRSFDLSTVEGYAGLWAWAVRDGRREMPLVAGVVARSRDALLCPTDWPEPKGLPLTFPWTASLLWLVRSDLQAAFPLDSGQSVAAYLAWFLRTGVFEARSGDLLAPSHRAIMAATAESPLQPPVVHFLMFLHASRQDLRERFDIGDFEGRRDYIKWFCGPGLAEIPTEPAVLEAQKQALFDWGKTLTSADALAS